MRRITVAITLLATAVLVAVPATASAALRTFRSPSGNLGCMFYSDAQTPRTVRCEWRGGNDRAVTLTERGKGKRIKITDTVLDPKAKVLAYGKTTKFGSFMVSVQKQRVY